MRSEEERELNKNSSIIGAAPDTVSPSVNTKLWRQAGERDVDFIETALNGEFLSPPSTCSVSLFLKCRHPYVSQQQDLRELVHQADSGYFS